MENTRSSSRRRRQHYSQSDGLLHEVPALLGHHEKQLVEGSAIDPEVIEARGYRSIEESKELGDFPKDVQKLVPGFRVPVWTVDGERGSPQYRPDEPRDNPKKPGKKNKYENRWRAPVRLDVHPWNSAQKLFDVSVALHITEGIKKADSGTSRGLCVVALLGVDCWQREGKPLADWDSIPLKDRVVYLEFDSDLMEKREVQRALRKLKRFLESRGATVKVVYFEAKPNGEKVGLDDYFAVGGTAEGLDNLVKQLGGVDEIIDLTDSHLGEKVDKVLAYLEDRNESLRIHQRSGVLVEPGPEEEYQAIIPHRMLYLLGHAPFYKEQKSGDLVKVDPPDRLISALLNAREVWPFPILDRVIRSPVFNADGSLHVDPGYHEPTKTLYISQPGLKSIPEVPEQPSDEELKAAVNLLLELIHDFPFETKADKATALALMIEPFVRDLIDGKTPLYGINAYNPGTGKGLLADVSLIPALGHPDNIPGYSDVTSDNEMRKKITAAGLAARQVFFLDNVNYKVEYSSLASALTRHTITDRVLGVSRDVTLRLKWTWLVNGNHLRYSDEVQRRVVPCNLASKDPEPHLRSDFLHKLPEWAVENRHRLIAAVLTVVRRWLAEGRPGPGDDVPRFGSFEAWREVMGGILRVAGSRSFLRNLMGTSGHESAERVLLGVFLRAAWETFEEERFGAASVREKLAVVARELVPDGDPGDRKFDTQLGLWLSNHSRKPVQVSETDRVWYVPDGVYSKTGATMYRVEKV